MRKSPVVYLWVMGILLLIGATLAACGGAAVPPEAAEAQCKPWQPRSARQQNHVPHQQNRWWRYHTLKNGKPPPIRMKHPNHSSIGMKMTRQ